MAKRFTDTNKWRKGFVRGLQGAYKLLWLYIIDECDHAGIWHVEIDVAELRIGMKISVENAIKEFGNHIVIFDEGNKWFIPDFIEFQYGTLNPENRAHKSVLDLLEKYKIKGLIRPLQGRKDMDMVKAMDMDKEDFIGQIILKFQESYKQYRNTEYEVVNIGKERSAAGKLLNLYKKKVPNSDTSKTLTDLKNYFDGCVNICDGWLYTNMSLPMILNKFNEINTILRNGNKQKYNKGGATDAELAAIIAFHFPE